MASLNTGAYGQTLYADLGQHITGATELTFILQPRRGDKQIKTANVSIGLVNIVVGDYKLIANQYLEYVIQKGDLDEDVFIGTGWRTKGECILGSSKIIGDYKKITVLE